LVDAAYIDAYQLVESNQVYQVSLIGPVAVDTSWQAKSDTGFDVSTFVIDWDKQVVQCPQGHLSRLWRKAHDCNGNPLIEVVFDRHTCGACPVRNNCTSSAKVPRKLKLRPQAEYLALKARRIEQLSQEFKLALRLSGGN
jgi:transposase